MKPMTDYEMEWLGLDEGPVYRRHDVTSPAEYLCTFTLSDDYERKVDLYIVDDGKSYVARFSDADASDYYSGPIVSLVGARCNLQRDILSILVTTGSFSYRRGC